MEEPVAYLFGSRVTWRIPRIWNRPLAYLRYLVPIAAPLDDSSIFLLLIILLACMIVLAITLESGSLLQAHSYAGFVHGTFERGLLFSFIPGSMISVANSVLLMSDNYHRTLQPIRGMDKPNAARENILIDYISPNPIATILTALSNGHYRISLGAFVALICPLGPIVAASLFTFDDDLQTFQVSPQAAYAALTIVCIYILAVPFARIDVKYAAGRGLWNIVDTLSLCYDSAILKCPEFRVREKIKDEEVFLQCRVILAKRLYQFGYYLGESGRRRGGFSVAKMMPLQSNNSEDRTRRYRLLEEDEEDASDEADNVVDRTKTSFIVRSVGFYIWFRGPRLFKSGSSHGLQRADTEMAIGEGSFEGTRSLSSSESRSERFESDAFRMTPVHHIHSAAGGEDGNASPTEDTADEQLGEVSFAHSTAVQSDDQEFNTLLRRQFTI
ncbi:unnamed protein product [Penicillium salamii]|nr:unnamed protein product [Penicillium salamii]